MCSENSNVFYTQTVFHWGKELGSRKLFDYARLSILSKLVTCWNRMWVLTKANKDFSELLLIKWWSRASILKVDLQILFWHYKLAPKWSLDSVQVNCDNRYSLGREWFEDSSKEKDLGVSFGERFNMSQQCVLAAQKTNCISDCTKGSVTSRLKELDSASALMRPHLGYCIQFWGP